MALEVLIVDDEKDIREILSSVIEDEGYIARTASNSDEALSEINVKAPSLVVLDVWLNNSKLDGVEILTEIKKTNPEIPVIMISGHGTLDMAVSATKKGAYDFLSKPFKTDALLNTMTRALDTVKLKTEVDNLQNKLGIGQGDLIGNSKYVAKINEAIGKMAKSDKPVLILGDTGTGKEIVANQLYKESDIKGNMVAFDCNDVNEKEFDKSIKSLFENSTMSMILIDNVDNLNIELQKKLVDKISNNKLVRAVFIATDKKNIEPSLIKFIGKSIINTIPLNDRLEDIVDLANNFMKYKAKSRGKTVKTFDPSAITALMNHNWVGNIWELVNVIEKLIVDVKDNIIVADDIKKCINNSNSDSNDIGMEEILMLDLKTSRNLFEKYYLTFHLKRFGGNVTHTSEYVGMDRAALSRKIKTLDIKIDG
ncbi:MAG: sigma-54-dependent transcriptional regulator [Alphaproteobacteria bacterium]